jgi:hypothetical protein
MARFRCRACCQKGDFVYDPQRHACPRCGSPDVQIALGIEEMPNELIDRMIEGLGQAELLDDDSTDKD